MDSIDAVVLSPWGRVILLSLVIGLATQGIKQVTPKETWLRALLPAIPVLLGGICGVIPGILTGEATLLLGMGAGALSATTVELWNRYQDQIEVAAVKKMEKGK